MQTTLIVVVVVVILIIVLCFSSQNCMYTSIDYIHTSTTTTTTTITATTSTTITTSTTSSSTSGSITRLLQKIPSFYIFPLFLYRNSIYSHII